MSDYRSRDIRLEGSEPIEVQDVDGPEVDVFRQMAEHTVSECAECRVPYACCGSTYCEIAIEYSRTRYGVELRPTGHSSLPLMGAEGCTAPPHMRPICTVHTCDVACFGEKLGDSVWNERYFQLRDEIDDHLLELLRSTTHA